MVVVEVRDSVRQLVAMEVDVMVELGTLGVTVIVVVVPLATIVAGAAWVCRIVEI